MDCDFKHLLTVTSITHIPDEKDLTIGDRLSFLKTISSTIWAAEIGFIPTQINASDSREDKGLTTDLIGNIIDLRLG